MLNRRGVFSWRCLLAVEDIWVIAVDTANADTRNHNTLLRVADCNGSPDRDAACGQGKRFRLSGLTLTACRALL